MFKKRKLAKKLAEIGSKIDTAYLAYINNDEPRSFSSRAEALSYLESYRQENVIFKLQLFRIETYSL